MDVLLESLRQIWDEIARLSPRLVLAVLTVVVFGGLGRVLGVALSRAARRAGRAEGMTFFARALVSWLLTIVGIVVALNLMGWGSLAASLLATGGLMAVVFGFAFREIGENLLAGVLLAFNRPFDQGDLIQSGSLMGTVKDVELRHVHIRTADGCDVYVPSADLVRQPLYNYTHDGLRRAGFQLGIDYGDDPAEARRLVLEAMRGVEGVLERPAPAVLLAEFETSFQRLQAFLWVDTFDPNANFGEIRSQAMERARAALREAGFTFSSDVTTAVDMRPVQVQLENDPPAVSP